VFFERNGNDGRRVKVKGDVAASTGEQRKTKRITKKKTRKRTGNPAERKRLLSFCAFSLLLRPFVAGQGQGEAHLRKPMMQTTLHVFFFFLTLFCAADKQHVTASHSLNQHSYHQQQYKEEEEGGREKWRRSAVRR
jgi:hypothetical protein